MESTEQRMGIIGHETVAHLACHTLCQHKFPLQAILLLYIEYSADLLSCSPQITVPVVSSLALKAQSGASTKDSLGT